MKLVPPLTSIFYIIWQQAFESPKSNSDMTLINPVIVIMEKIYFKCNCLLYVCLWIVLLKT